MNRKKLLALVIVLLVSVGLLSGCSQTEIGFFNLKNEINSLNVSETQGTIALNFNQLPAALTKNNSVGMTTLQNQLSKYNLEYDIKMDPNKPIYDGNISLADKTTGSKQEILSFIGSGDTAYIRVDELINYLQTLGDSDLNQELATVFGNAKYVSINTKEIERLNNNPGQTVPGAIFSFPNMQKQQALSRSLLDGLIHNVFNQYTTGMVQKDNNKYTLTLDKTAVLNNLKPFLVYSINHMENISTFAKNFINGLDSEELAMLSLTPEMKATALASLDKLTPEVVNHRDKYLAQIDGITNMAATGMNMIGEGTKIITTMEKLDPKTYKQTTDMALKIKAISKPADNFDFAINSSSTISVIAPFSITIPDTGVISFTELQNKMPRVLEVNTVNNSYTLTQGLKTSKKNIDIRNINNRIYLPMRQVAETLNENVGWNASTRQAYVDRNGKTFNMTGVLINNSTYVQIRDFEKLGYKVDWNSQLRLALIQGQ